MEFTLSFYQIPKPYSCPDRVSRFRVSGFEPMTFRTVAIPSPDSTGYLTAEISVELQMVFS